MKKIIPAFIILLLILVIGGGLYARLMRPNSRILDEEELVGMPAGQVRIYLDDVTEDAVGILREGLVYLPIEWTADNLNDHFYYDYKKDLLIYTQPESILYADLNTTGTAGNHLLIKEKDTVYVSSVLVASYSDAACFPFGDENTGRIFIYKSGSSYTTADILKKTQLRAGSSKKEPICRELAEGDTLRILDDPYKDEAVIPKDAWVYAQDDKGLRGYVLRSTLIGFEDHIYDTGYEAPVYSSIHMDEPVLLGWHQLSGAAGNKTIDKVLAASGPINVISPTWGFLSSASGELTSIESKAYVDYCHDKGVQVWILFDNITGDVDTAAFLADTDARGRFIENMTAAALSSGADGINLDFENIAYESGRDFVQFVRELSISCRKNHLVLSVDDPAAAEYSLYYGRGAQAECADYVINMGYDEHYVGSEKGSVASYAFEYDSLNLCLTEVPKEKLIAAIPFYTRLWEEEGNNLSSQAVGLGTAKNWVKENNITLAWDEDCGQYVGSSREGNRILSVWMEDNESLKLKMDLIKELDLAGAACWKLGLEDAEAWEVVNFQ